MSNLMKCVGVCAAHETLANHCDVQGLLRWHGEATISKK